MKQKIKNWFSRHKISKRRLIQLYAALLFNANLKGFKTGQIYKGNTKSVCLPGLNCYSCPGAVGACPLGSLQNALASSGKTIPYYVFGIIMLYGLLFGRWICGFLCPFGLVQELLHKIKTPKLKKGKVTRWLSYLKYVILVLFVVVYPLLYVIHLLPLPAFCKYICPAGTLEGAIGLLSNVQNSDLFVMLGPLFTWKFALLVALATLAIFIYRFFCRFLCPLGAIYGFFNKISLIGVKLDKSRCTDCGICVSKCKMDISHVGDHECISCGECISACPTSAIHWSGSKFMIAPDGPVSENKTDVEEWRKKNEKIQKRGKIIKAGVISLMAALLIAALAYFNFGDAIASWFNADEIQPEVTTESESENHTESESESKSETEINVPEGNAVGYLCYGLDVPLIDCSTDSFNVTENRGKITVINFWGTWCTPCVNELPHFDEIAAQYKDTVTVVALHSDYASETAADFIAQKHPDHTLLFGVDIGDAYYSMLGGRGTYPLTLVVDESGIVVHKQVGAMSYEQLKTVIDAALAD